MPAYLPRLAAVAAAVAALVPMAPAGADVPAAAAIEAMPRDLEIAYALAAAPPAMRADATVYVLDPAKGYDRAIEGTSGMECLVSRTAWEQADYRGDIYVPLCYDAAGSGTYLKVIREAAALRAGGMSPQALKAEIVRRYADGTYRPSREPGLSWMIAPVTRTWSLPDGQVHTASMPHVMTYAPGITDQAMGNMHAPDHTLPFAFQEGIPEQGYIVQTLGSAEETDVVKSEAALVKRLCAYRAELCMPSDPAALHPHRHPD